MLRPVRPACEAAVNDRKGWLGLVMIIPVMLIFRSSASLLQECHRRS
jgi:hypothetical protein